MKAFMKGNKPKLRDGAPDGYHANHHLWYIKQYRKWLSQKRKNSDQKNLT